MHTIQVQRTHRERSPKEPFYTVRSSESEARSIVRTNMADSPRRRSAAVAEMAGRLQRAGIDW